MNTKEYVQSFKEQVEKMNKLNKNLKQQLAQEIKEKEELKDRVLVLKISLEKSQSELRMAIDRNEYLEEESLETANNILRQIEEAKAKAYSGEFKVSKELLHG